MIYPAAGLLGRNNMSYSCGLDLLERKLDKKGALRSAVLKTFVPGPGSSAPPSCKELLVKHT